MERMNPPGSRLCEGRPKFIHPEKAKTKDGEWRYIYQRKEGKLMPRIYVEECIKVFLKGSS